MSARKITILGFGPSAATHPDLAAAVAGREVWTLNNGWQLWDKAGIKADRWFALHTPEAITQTYYDQQGHDPWTMLDVQGCPVFMRYPCPSRIRHSVGYPFREVFGFHRSNFCLGSPSYMLALALYEGVKDIESFGIDMQDDAHRQQQSSWAYWCSRAQTLGIKMGGTSLHWMREPELDAGLVGLREWVGDVLTGAAPYTFEEVRVQAKCDIERVAKKPVAAHLGGHCGVTHIDVGALGYLKTHEGVKSMIDIGCGPGDQVRAAMSLGMDAEGIDGDWTCRPKILHDYTTGPLDHDPVDLAWSCEFLEHVPESCAENYMRTFSAARIVVATANPNPGRWHTNPQPREYWAKLFEAHGFSLDEELTEAIRKESTMKREFMRETGMAFRRAEAA